VNQFLSEAKLPEQGASTKYPVELEVQCWGCRASKDSHCVADGTVPNGNERIQPPFIHIQSHDPPKFSIKSARCTVLPPELHDIEHFFAFQMREN